MTTDISTLRTAAETMGGRAGELLREAVAQISALTACLQQTEDPVVTFANGFDKGYWHARKDLPHTDWREIVGDLIEDCAIMLDECDSGAEDYDEQLQSARRLSLLRARRLLEHNPQPGQSPELDLQAENRRLRAVIDSLMASAGNSPATPAAVHSVIGGQPMTSLYGLPKPAALQTPEQLRELARWLNTVANDAAQGIATEPPVICRTAGEPVDTCSCIRCN